MRPAGLSLVAALALVATPAFAGSYGSAAANGETNNPTASSSTTTNSGQQGQLSNDTRQKLRQSLEQSGFKNVEVMPEAFLIRAQAPDGSHIVMQVSPDMAEGMVVGSGSSTNPNEPQNNNTSSGTQNGWKH